MIRKLKLLIEYEGTQYHGWQVQSNGITIQEILQGALQKITGRKTTVIASGRTDAGVHAEGQVAHISTPSKLTCRELLMAINSLLQQESRNMLYVAITRTQEDLALIGIQPFSQMIPNNLLKIK